MTVKVVITFSAFGLCGNKVMKVDSIVNRIIIGIVLLSVAAGLVICQYPKYTERGRAYRLAEDRERSRQSGEVKFFGYPDSDTAVIPVGNPPTEYIISSYLSTRSSITGGWSSQPWGAIVVKDPQTGELKVKD